MKKLLSVLLVLCFLIPSAVAEAPVDVKALSDDELKSLYKEAKKELINRQLWDEAVLPAGVYQAGKGLPEGTYVCKITSKSGIYNIYKNYDDFQENKYIEWGKLYEGESFLLSLYGETVYYVSFTGSLSPYNGLSW